MCVSCVQHDAMLGPCENQLLEVLFNAPQVPLAFQDERHSPERVATRVLQPGQVVEPLPMVGVAHLPGAHIVPMFSPTRATARFAALVHWAVCHRALCLERLRPSMARITLASVGVGVDWPSGHRALPGLALSVSLGVTASNSAYFGRRSQRANQPRSGWTRPSGRVQRAPRRC